MDLITCVSSSSALRAAVKSGADMVRAGLRGLCRFGGEGFPASELTEAAGFCLSRGVGLCVSLDRPVPAARFPEVVETAVQLASAGVSAFCVGDVGLLKALRIRLPDTPLYASDAMGVHDSSGTGLLASLGATRLCLPPQLSRDGLQRMLQRCPVETEILVFGEACLSCGLPCRLGAFDAPSVDRGACSGLCRQSFGYGTAADGFRPALRTVSLAEHLPELQEMGIAAAVINAYGRSAEHTAALTDMFARALRSGRAPSRRDTETLYGVLCPDGVSDAYYAGEPEQAVQGRNKPLRAQRSRSTVWLPDPAGERQRIPVTMRVILRRGMPMQLSAEDARGNIAAASGPMPEPARSGKRELTEALLRTQLYNTLGTPFLCREALVELDPGLSVPSADVSRLRRQVLDRLMLLGSRPAAVRTAPLPPLLRCESPYSAPELSISVRKAAQLTPELAAARPLYLFVPLEVLEAEPARVTPFWENGHTTICAVLPPIVPDADALSTYRSLGALRDLQIRDVMVHSLSQLVPAKVLGFRVHCGVGLAVSNDWSLRVLQDSGAVSATLSPEMSLKQLASLSKCMDTSLYAYGRVPLLSTETCLIKAAAGSCDCHRAGGLRDRAGRLYPLQRTGGCRNILYTPDKIFLGDRLKTLKGLGVRTLHLAFTTENARECVTITGRYLGMNAYVPGARMRGYDEEDKAGTGFRVSKKAGPSGDAGPV